MRVRLPVVRLRESGLRGAGFARPMVSHMFERWRYVPGRRIPVSELKPRARCNIPVLGAGVTCRTPKLVGRRSCIPDAEAACQTLKRHVRR